MVKIFLLPVVIIMLVLPISGQAEDPSISDTTNKTSLRFVGFPVLGYSPETRTIGGAYTQLIAGNPEYTRPSTLGLGLLVSQNRQYSINFFPELWWNQNQYRLAGELKWQHWPDKFYGIGNDTHEEDEEYYISRIWGIKLDLMKSFYKQLYSGILLEIENNNIVEYDTVPHAALPEGTLAGSEQSIISGLGLGMAWDSRNDILLPSSGAYYQFRLVYFNPFMGSTYPYTKWIADLRKYWTLGKDHLFYLQVYGKFLWGKEIPFRNMAMLGGDKLLRGYFKGRYRDHNMILAQAEYHTPPIWRISFVAFAGAGDVFHSASTLGNLKIKPAGGIGFRYKVFRDRRMNARLDFALGNGDSGIYLGILEAF